MQGGGVLGLPSEGVVSFNELVVSENADTRHDSLREVNTHGERSVWNSVLARVPNRHQVNIIFHVERQRGDVTDNII